MSKLLSLSTLISSITLFNLSACGDKAEDSAVAAFECPAADDACMTEELHQECLSLVETCSGEILIAESCPVQFSCAE